MSRFLTKSYPDVGSVIKTLKPSLPLLCFNPNKIYDNINLFKKGFNGTVGWAVKCNPHPEIIKAIVKGGINEFDVASADEIERIKKYCPDGIMHFNHPVKPIEEIKYAYFKAGIRNFVLDDFAELEKIVFVLEKGKITDFSDITLLVRYRNTDKIEKAQYDFGKKFGAMPDDAVRLIRTAHDTGFQVGLAFHPGSQNENPDISVSMINRGIEIGKLALNGTKAKLVRLNVGGGFPCHYPDRAMPDMQDYFKAINLAAKPFKGELFCEPGRALVANCISVITRVNLRKADGHRVYLNDGFYGSFMELPFVSFLPPFRVFNPDGTEKKSVAKDLAMFEVWGPTCDSLDRLPKPIRLPKSIATGDYIEFGLMGSYTNATATEFNGIETAKMILVDHLRDWNNPDTQ